MSLRLPEEKLFILKQELQSSLCKTRFTKRQLQSLAGRLSWAASVVKGGRVFLRRIFNPIRMLWHNAHRVRVSHDLKKDLIWWSTFIDTFNGRSMLIDQCPIECVFTDASDDGAGGCFGGDWFYFNWSCDWPQAASFHINEKEVIAVTLAAYCWCPLWRNKRIIIYSDNSVTVSALNKGTCRNSEIMRCIRSLFWLSARYNFHLTARHLPGIQNIAADGASRVSSPGYLEVLWPFTDASPLHCHMSPTTLLFLLNRYPNWRRNYQLWSGKCSREFACQPGPRGTPLSSEQFFRKYLKDLLCTAISFFQVLCRYGYQARSLIPREPWEIHCISISSTVFLVD